MPGTTVSEAREPASASDCRFEREAVAVLNRVRGAFSGLLTSVAQIGSAGEGGAGKATDLQRKLGIPSTIAWRVHRVGRAEDPFSEVESVPGAGAIRRVIQAGRRKGLPADRLAELGQAIDAFESLVRDHAGSRQTLNAMVAGLGGSGSEWIDTGSRKAAFLNNSHIWGMQSRVTLLAGLYHPGSQSESLHHALISGTADLKRFHPDVRRQVLLVRCGETREQSRDRQGSQCAGVQRATNALLHGRGSVAPPGRFGPVILEDFSTQPLPIVDRSMCEDGRERIELLPATLGRRGATTCFVAEAALDGDRSVENPDEPYAINLRCWTPAEAVVIDVLIHEDMFPPLKLQSAAFDGRDDAPSTAELLARRRLPVKVDVSKLGRGLDAMHSADLPRYPQMVEHTCAMLGWDASKFEVYRCRLEYPIMSSITAVWFDRPVTGNW